MTDETITTFLGRGQKEEQFLISDIAKYGCSGGVAGLTYYKETCAFYDKHKTEIWDLLYDLSEDTDFSIPYLMSDFDGARQVTCEDSFKNFLVWWAVKHVARDIENGAEDERETTLEKMDTMDKIDHLERRMLLDAQMNGDE
jgi:hypothetical protein